jgi:hypothetical protein
MSSTKGNQNGNQKKTLQLGMAHGTAWAKLRKMILFSVLEKHNENTCYRCGNIIENASELSIDHKIPYLDSNKPQELFFDINNVAFSHLICNISAGRHIYAVCGNKGAYNRGCRCEKCRKWKSINNKKYEHRTGSHVKHRSLG